ncbi:MAG: SH3 domain-containing protein [Chloroflexi bacterium]|nr:SH3 domain-containing protein [Chloroflexota bacterium]
MKNRKFLIIGAGIAIVFLLLCLACLVFIITTASSPTVQATLTAQALARVTQSPQNSPSTSSTPTDFYKPTQASSPTSTSILSISPPTQTPTPLPVRVSAKQTVNVRQGPGIQFAIVGKLQPNNSSVVLGKDADGQWLQIAFPDSANPGWVSKSVVSVNGSVDSLQVIAVATKAPTAKTVLNSNENEYVQAVTSISRDYSSAFTQLGILLTTASDNPALILDNVWTLKTAYNITLIKDSGTRLRKLKPPTRFASSHASLIEAANHYDKAMDLLVAGIDNLDASKLQKSIAEMSLGNAAVDRATEKINQLLGQ